GPAVRLNTGDARDDSVSVHGARSGLLGDIDVAAEARYGDIRNEERVPVPMHVQASHGEFAADARRRIMPGPGLDDLAALDQPVQFGFQVFARGAVPRSLSQ